MTPPDWSAWFNQPGPASRPDSYKWQRYAGTEVLPLWLADMEFATAPSIIDTLQQRLSLGCYQYPVIRPELEQAVVDYCARRYDWAIEPDWLVWLPALVPALHLACQLIEPQQAVLSLTPIYPPFLNAPRQQQRRLQTVPLRYHDRWQLDREALDAAVTPDSRLFLLCHPHNPVGRAWSHDELQYLADWAERRDLWVCSDEVHCDLLFDGRRHRPFASLSPAAAARSITLMSPSKTFNLAGLGCAFAIISNPELRARFQRLRRGLVPEPAWPGLIACEAALTDRSGWYPALIAQLEANRTLLEQGLAGTGWLRAPIEATYLAFLDLRTLQQEAIRPLFEQVGVGLAEGADFGWPGFGRLNFACPTPMLEQALTRMRRLTVTER